MSFLERLKQIINRSIKSLSGIIIITVVLFTGCEEKIDLNLNENNERLVVEGSITNQDTLHKIVLSKTADYLSAEQTPRVSGAIVKVSDNQNTYTFKEKSKGIYIPENSFAGENGKTYNLTIDLKESINDKTTYTAQETMPQSLYLDSVTAEPLDDNIGKDDVQIKAWGQEPGGQENYYVWDLEVNGESLTDTLDQKSFTDDELVDGSYIPGLPILFYDGEVNDTIKVYTQSITAAYYDFLLAFIREASSGGGGFSGPPANVEGNISGGALGYFSVKAVTTNQTIYRK